MTDVAVHWKELYQLLDKHPDWAKYLDDKGAGSPPQSFKIVIEKGIRSYAFADKAKLTMGIGKTKKVTRYVYKQAHPCVEENRMLHIGRSV